jgi:hypothetical protein
VTSRAMSCNVLVRVCLVIQLLHHQPQMGAATWVPPCQLYWLSKYVHIYLARCGC